MPDPAIVARYTDDLDFRQRVDKAFIVVERLFNYQSQDQIDAVKALAVLAGDPDA